MTQDLARILGRIGRPRIAVVGDAILDEYVWGEVERISPEGPIPVLRVARREHRAGGAGSVASNLGRLGADVAFFGVRGADPAGEKLAGLLGLDGVDAGGAVVEVVSLTQTGGSSTEPSAATMISAVCFRRDISAA